jgi:hypothetical protein
MAGDVDDEPPQAENALRGVENELRLAMADEVGDLAAPRSLAHDVIRRHGRRVLRNRLLVAASVGAVLAGGLPAYRALAPAVPGGPVRPGVDVAVSATPLPRSGGPPPAPAPGASRSRQPNRQETNAPGQSAPASQVPRRRSGVVLGYLPAGLRRDGRCDTQRFAGRQTTACRWEGEAASGAVPGGGLGRSWVEVRVVREPGLSRADDLGFPAPRTREVRVNGEPGIAGFLPDGSRQVVWRERSGVGVYVGVSPSMADDLIKIADGVRVS